MWLEARHLGAATFKPQLSLSCDLKRCSHQWAPDAGYNDVNEMDETISSPQERRLEYKLSNLPWVILFVSS